MKNVIVSQRETFLNHKDFTMERVEVKYETLSLKDIRDYYLKAIKENIINSFQELKEMFSKQLRLIKSFIELNRIIDINDTLSLGKA